MEGAGRVREGRLVAGWPVMFSMQAPAAGLQWGAGRPRRGWWLPVEELLGGRGELGQRSPREGGRRGLATEEGLDWAEVWQMCLEGRTERAQPR